MSSPALNPGSEEPAGLPGPRVAVQALALPTGHAPTLLGAVSSVVELQPRLSLARMPGFAAEEDEGQLCTKVQVPFGGFVLSVRFPLHGPGQRRSPTPLR